LLNGRESEFVAKADFQELFFDRVAVGPTIFLWTKPRPSIFGPQGDGTEAGQRNTEFALH